MKKIFAVLLSVLMLLSLLTACGGDPTEGTTPPDPTKVNLMDMYTVSDPEGVEYDQRVALYAPTLESEESYASGSRHIFAVLYGKDGKGVYMYDIIVFDTAESANTYLEAAGEGTVDGAVYISECDATFFAAMEAFIPNLQTWIDNMMASGMIEVE